MEMHASASLYTIGGIIAIVTSLCVFKKCKNPQIDIETGTVAVEHAASSMDDSDSEIQTLDFDKVYTKSCDIFPALMKTVTKDKFQNDVHRLKKFLREQLEVKTTMDPSLLDRVNGPELLLSMGLAKTRMESVVRTIIGIERELNVVGKDSLHDALLLLIDELEFTKPLGDINNKIDVFQGQKPYSHLGVEFAKGKLKSTIEEVASHLHEANIENRFMHGTSASCACGILKNHMLRQSVGRHDFGSGIYCFRGQGFDSVVKPLSFAISKAVLYNGNPCIVVFLEHSKVMDKKGAIIDVNRRIIKDKNLKDALGDQGFQDFQQRRSLWNNGNWKKDNRLTWKTFVWVSRTNAAPYRAKVFSGYLHDASADKIRTTNEGGEPVVDSDEWIQYCVPVPALLGKKFLFVEFHINYDEWHQVKDIDCDLMNAWKQHCQAR